MCRVQNTKHNNKQVLSVILQHFIHSSLEIRCRCYVKRKVVKAKPPKWGDKCSEF